MRHFLRELFSEKSTVSSMRVMSMICCWNAVIVSIVGLSKAQPDYSGISLLASTFLAAAFGGKLAQKRIEVDGAKSETQTEIKN
jgi:hypothetical protein